MRTADEHAEQAEQFAFRAWFARVEGFRAESGRLALLAWAAEQAEVEAREEESWLVASAVDAVLQRTL